jgi:glycosyltransferase involved in cell wall biosynthesis
MDKNFSVLIPAKGECEYLIETLTSVLSSTVIPFQIILVDDGIASEVMQEVIKLQAELPIIVVPNSGYGLVDALNTGLNLCTTEFTARLDGDDLITPKRFELQLDFLTQNSSVVAVGGQVTYIDSTGKITGSSHYRVGRLDSLSDFQSECMLAHPAVMMCTADVKRIGGYRSICNNGRVDLAEDFDLWLRLSNIGQIHNLEESILQYRQHAGQISTVHTASQVFSAKYVSFVHQAESKDANFRFVHLLVQPFNRNFLVEAFKSLSNYISFKDRFILVLEGLIIYFDLRNRLLARIIRKFLLLLG